MPWIGSWSSPACDEWRQKRDSIRPTGPRRGGLAVALRPILASFSAWGGRFRLPARIWTIPRYPLSLQETAHGLVLRRNSLTLSDRSIGLANRSLMRSFLQSAEVRVGQSIRQAKPPAPLLPPLQNAENSSPHYLLA